MKFHFRWPIKLVPYEKKFFEMLRASADNLLIGATLLLDLVQNYENVKTKVKKIKEIEHKGDKITHDIYQLVRDIFIHPIAPEDMHKLASELDDVLDAIEGIASRLLNFGIEKPIPECITIVELIHEAGQNIQTIIHGLDKPNHTHDLEKFHIRINEIENKVDQITQEKVGQLIRNEQNWRTAIVWKEILGRLEQAADHCENVSYFAQEVEVKNA